MVDRTDNRRGPARARVELDVDLATYGRYFLTKLRNVSIGGAFICSKKLHPTGTDIKIRFKLPDHDKPIEAEGKVVWTYRQPSKDTPNASGMGIRFTNLRPEDQTRIADFVARSTQS